MAIQHLTAVPASCCGAELCPPPPGLHSPPAPMAAYPHSPEPTPSALVVQMRSHPGPHSTSVLAIGLQRAVLRHRAVCTAAPRAARPGPIPKPTWRCTQLCTSSGTWGGAEPCTQLRTAPLSPPTAAPTPLSMAALRRGALGSAQPSRPHSAARTPSALFWC